VTIYGSAGSCAGEVYSGACVRVYCSGSLYHLNKKSDSCTRRNKYAMNNYISNYVSTSQWQGMWLCVERAINMKFCNINDVLYDRWNKS